MKRVFFAAFFAALISFSVSCEKKRELHIYNWADYIKPEVVSAFEKKFNCKIVMDYFDSNESMYAKIKSGATGYDLIVPTSYMAEVMNSEGMIIPIDKSKIPNLK